MRLQASVANDEPRRTLVEVAATRIARHDDPRARSRPGLRCKRAAVERVEAHASPPPANERQRERNEETALEGNGRGSAEQHRRPRPSRIRACETQTQRTDERVRRVAAEERHGATSPLSCSRRAGPMPGTASSSSTDEKPPCCCR